MSQDNGAAWIAPALDEIGWLGREVERLRAERDVYREWARATACAYPFPRTLHAKVLELLRSPTE